MCRVNKQHTTYFDILCSGKQNRDITQIFSFLLQIKFWKTNISFPWPPGLVHTHLVSKTVSVWIKIRMISSLILMIRKLYWCQRSAGVSRFLPIRDPGKTFFSMFPVPWDIVSHKFAVCMISFQQRTIKSKHIYREMWSCWASVWPYMLEIPKTIWHWNHYLWDPENNGDVHSKWFV